MFAKRLGWFGLVLLASVTCGGGGSGAPSGTSSVPREVLARIAPCGAGEPRFATLPVDPTKVLALQPLGHVAPPGHTFPSDHMYFWPHSGEMLDIKSPGPLTVVEIASSEIVNVSPPLLDYSIYLRPCREFQFYLYHVKELAPSFAAKVGAIGGDKCFSYRSGSAEYRRCNMNVNVRLEEGEPIGRGGFDFGALDGRVPLPYLNPSRAQSFSDGVDFNHVVCPVDYFRDDKKAELRALISDYSGTVKRTREPWCGEVAQDVAGAAMGRWFVAGTTGVVTAEDPHLALVRDNDFQTDRQILSVGTSASASGLATGYYLFTPQTAGTHNRDLTQVHADGAVYCYDGFPTTGAILLDMPSPSTLRIERSTASRCEELATPALSDKATLFER